jgi:hypothetical protein
MNITQIPVIIFLFIQLLLFTFLILWHNRAIKAELALRALQASQVTTPPYSINDSDILEIIESLDDTGGYLVKESELKYWIETHVKRATAPKP